MEMQDYAGDFIPNLKLEDFSKAALIRLITEAGKGILGIDGIWRTLYTEKHGWDLAHKMNMEIWTGERNFNKIQDQPRICEAFNIKGKDVAAMFKYLQVTPTVGVFNWTMQFNLKNNNHGILSITACKTLEYCERHNDTQLAKDVCQEMDSLWFPVVLPHYFNPKIKVTQLVPIHERPRKVDCGQPLCQWEYKLEE